MNGLELLELALARRWLAKVTQALNRHWQTKNQAKQKGLAAGGEKGTLLMDEKH